MTNYRNEPENNLIKKIFEIVIAVTAWTAILFQAYLTTGSMANLFSYFTILTNLLVAVCSSILLLNIQNKIGSFFRRPSVQTAITLYIFIVALVYNTVLRGIVSLNGWNLFVDTLLHVVVPILFIVYWFMYVPKGVLQWKQGISWIYFPMAYLVYSLIRGAVFGWYPYPFLNVVTFGYPKVILNVIIMIAVFFLAGLALIMLNRRLGNRKKDL